MNELKKDSNTGNNNNNIKIYNLRNEFSSFLLIVSFSEIGILAIAVGGSIGIVLLILIIYIIVRVFRRQDNDMDVEMEDYGSKDQVLWEGTPDSGI